MTTDRTEHSAAWLQQADAIEAELTEARSMLLNMEVSGTSGPVTISLGATGELRDIRFDGGELPDAASLRSDILAAHARALTAVRETAEDMMRPLQTLFGEFEWGGR